MHTWANLKAARKKKLQHDRAYFVLDDFQIDFHDLTPIWSCSFSFRLPQLCTNSARKVKLPKRING